MLFNSIGFAFFLPVVYVLYWFIANRNLKIQNLLLLVSSYFFYACWDWRFLFLLVFSTVLDYFTGLKMAESTREFTRKFWFWTSITINLGFLGVFKYYNFFAGSFASAVSLLGFEVSPFTLSVILPVGISFYTFHGLSYVIDIYYNRIKAETNFTDYSVFVSFFPLLVAGPIERATHLLPQIKKARTFDYARSVDGLRQILWGLVKKVVIADQCAEYANRIFNQSDQYTGATLVLGALMFTFQIYGDFSGYSDIALGTARLFGIELLRNFAFPYFSRDIAEFWRRWHISLSSWFRDYLYIPLGGSKGGTWMKVRNTFVIFLVSGFWHGANWTFIVWGLLNALYIMPSIVLNTNRVNLEIVAKGKYFPGFNEAIQMAVTFSLTVVAWVFFRSESIEQALSFCHHMVEGLFGISGWRMAHFFLHTIGAVYLVILLLFFVVEWLGRENEYALARILNPLPQAIRYPLYVAMAIAVVLYSDKEAQFIYFQF